MPKEKSPLLKEKEQIVDRPIYSETEQEYIKGLRKRLESARDARDMAHPEWDNMDYTTYYEENERLANTFIKPKINKEDTNYQSGTIRQKVFALLSALVNLDLRGDISAYSKDGFKIQAIGDAMEDIILKVDEYDNDDEKKLLRQYELLKHGTVFVEELWDEKSKVEKKTKKKFDGKLNYEWAKKTKKAFARPTRNIVPGINVYLGDITQYDMSEQPFMFTVDAIPYEEAKRMFKDWDRWNNVSRKVERFDAKEQGGLFNKDWTLLKSKEDYVEIIRYQDRWANEFALILNGVLMTPVGMPLPWGYEDYNLAQQNLEPIHAKFAYGKSLVIRTKNKVALLDELARLAVLKTQKSFMPPRYNISGRVVSNRVFMPGKVSYGLQAGSLPPIEGENEGVTASEFNMIKYIEESINSETTSPIFSGQQATGSPTATEIIELQRQAKMVLGLTIHAVSMLEWKLSWLRLQNLLANWFEAEDEAIDQARGVLKNKYRKTTTGQMIEGEGMGARMVIPTREVPSDKAIMDTEDYLTQERGLPIRLIFINPEEVCSSKLVWQIVVRPKEKKTSEVNKLLFRAFLQDIAPLGPNIDYLREKASSIWEENSQKLFAQPMEIPMPVEGEEPMRGRVPTAEKIMDREINESLKVGI